MQNVLITRAAEEAKVTAQKLRQFGLVPIIAPLVKYHPLPHPTINFKPDVLLVTSPRAMLYAKKIHKETGAKIIMAGNVPHEQLALQQYKNPLYLRGDIISREIDGVCSAIVYRSEFLPLADDIKMQIRHGKIVAGIFYSRSVLKHFLTEIQPSFLFCCLSQRIADGISNSIAPNKAGDENGMMNDLSLKIRCIL